MSSGSGRTLAAQSTEVQAQLDEGIIWTHMGVPGNPIEVFPRQSRVHASTSPVVHGKWAVTTPERVFKQLEGPEWMQVWKMNYLRCDSIDCGDVRKSCPRLETTSWRRLCKPTYRRSVVPSA